MRLLFLGLLAALGLFGSADARHPSRRRVASAGERVQQEGVAVDLAERASPPGAPAQVAAHVGRSPTSSRLADGSAGLLGERRFARLRLRGVERKVETEPPRPATFLSRRQPEGRGPPRSPRAA